MKKTGIVFLMVLVLLCPSVFAQNTSFRSSKATFNNSPAETQRMMRARYAPRAGQMGMYPDIMNKEKIEKFMQSLFEIGLLYKMLEQPTMVSTEGGVIVAYGNTLRKYDKDLNFVKEVGLDVNTDNMQAIASKLAKKYSSEFMDMMGQTKGSPSASASTNTSNAKPYDAQREEKIKQEIEQMK